MDPDANIRERIAIWRLPVWDRATKDRLDELIDAYLDWRAMGGYPASTALLEELRITATAVIADH
jgi:hypothetical protein